jgi:hypothetical protein
MKEKARSTQATIPPNPASEEREEAFVHAFQDLCKEHGYQMAPEIYMVPTNHGTFELAVRLVIKPG